MDADRIDAGVAAAYLKSAVAAFGRVVKRRIEKYAGDGVFVDDCLSTAIPLISTHEIGHTLWLSTWVSGLTYTGHDHGPWPTGEGALMRSGTNDLGDIVEIPGRWIRHEDWKAANDTAGGL